MIKTLQKKFVITAMIAVTILMLSLLGVINVFNTVTVLNRSDRLLNDLSHIGNEQAPHIKDKPDGAFFDRAPNENDRISALYFSAKIGQNGEIKEINTDHIALSYKNEAYALCKKAVDSNKESGMIGHYKYKITVDPIMHEKNAVFMDVSSEFYDILRIALLSVVFGIIGWGIMLAIVILLSKKAILPIAENIERQKQFVADAGHEIKTPLAIILSNTEALELYQGENKWSQNIRKQTERLNGLMQSLLVLSKDGEEKTNIEKISLSDILKECTEMFTEPMEYKGICAKTNISENIEILADREQMLRLFSILIDNAVKYSPENTDVHIILTNEGKNTVFSVENCCEKLPECQPQKLFDRFYRADSARTQKSGGYGIGLSSAKTIVERYKGKIKAEYLKPDKIKFTVVF